ncbi:hypothetical protein [Aestuariivirga sp.]|uniref:hypothetical protein n=1 Tax=Aestuariivirga sp. TaxID=2650926 RepID=UPI003918D458
MSDNTTREEIQPDEVVFTVRPQGEWQPENRVWVTPDKAEEALRTMIQNSIAEACSQTWFDESRKALFATRTAAEVDAFLTPFLARQFATVMNRFVNEVIKNHPVRVVIEPNERKRTKVLRHDPQGRVLETESYYV